MHINVTIFQSIVADGGIVIRINFIGAGPLHGGLCFDMDLSKDTPKQEVKQIADRVVEILNGKDYKVISYVDEDLDEWFDNETNNKNT